jgi:hypothetical protein
MTQRQLEKLKDDWAKRLRLQDWKIAVTIKRSPDLKLEKTLGSCEYTLTQKRAEIELLHPDDYRAPHVGNRDFEWTLVHELLHLHTAPFYVTEPGPANDAQEIAIDLISEALVNLKREKSAVRKRS